MPKIRLDRFISNNLNISRKVSAEKIRGGLVAVNGTAVKSVSFSVDTEKDTVTFADKPVEYKKHIYIMMNKPAGILSASNDKSRKTVVDLVPDEMKRQGLFPVGRLDKDTTGLLFITDDGEFAHNCISPKKAIPKSYIVTLDGNIKSDAVLKFKEGIVLADGTKCKSATLEILKNNVARVIITEGKYHQIKRMFGTLGLGVDKLHRESVGNIKLPKTLKESQCLEMNLDILLKGVINNRQNMP